MAIYYINGTTLANSTSIFTDAELTICAADGHYSDGSGVVRRQVDCVLGAVQSCPSCLYGCGAGPITYNLSEGVFNLGIDLGTDPLDLGAVLVKFTAASIPDGIRATYNGNIYNKLSSPVDGYHGGLDPSGFTYLGVDSPPSSCAPVAGVTYTDLPEYRYDGTLFAPTGNTQTITPSANELSFSASVPGTSVMVIPKTSADINSLFIEIIGVCSSTAFTIEVDCPVLLTGFSASVVAGSLSAACALSLVGEYFNAPVAGTAGNPAITDWVFSDEYGSNVLAQGFYKISATEYIEVDANGVVIDRANC